MAIKVTITDPDRLPTIIDLIHDKWFDTDEIVWDPETAILRIRFKSEFPAGRQVVSSGWITKRVTVPFIEAFLTIYHVKSYSITDEVQVGIYDFNEVKYDSAEKRISLTTGVPIRIEITVEDFELSVELTDNIVELKETTSLLG